MVSEVAVTASFNETLLDTCWIEPPKFVNPPKPNAASVLEVLVVKVRALMNRTRSGWKPMPVLDRDPVPASAHEPAATFVIADPPNAM